MKPFKLGCASVLVLALTSPALATEWAGTLSGSYTHLMATGGDANAVGVDALGSLSLGWNGLSVQANADYNHLWSGISIDSGAFGGALVWSGSNGRIGAGANYHMVDSLSATTYGGGGEWYAGEHWTLGVRGGGLSGVGGATGGYVGGEVIKYFHPNLSLNLGVDYTSIGGLHTTDYGARLEYMPWRNISISGGYTFADFPGVGLHMLSIGLKFYCDGDAPTLVDNNRSEPSAFIGTFQSTIFKF